MYERIMPLYAIGVYSNDILFQLPHCTRWKEELRHMEVNYKVGKCELLKVISTIDEITSLQIYNWTYIIYFPRPYQFVW